MPHEVDSRELLSRAATTSGRGDDFLTENANVGVIGAERREYDGLTFFGVRPLHRIASLNRHLSKFQALLTASYHKLSFFEIFLPCFGERATGSFAAVLLTKDIPWSTLQNTISPLRFKSKSYMEAFD